MSTKRVDIEEFRDKGYLQEVNRRFFHPLGLALEIVVQEDGSMKLGGIWDSRDDKEGYWFGISETTEGEQVEFKQKADFIDKELAERMEVRREVLGFDIEPITDMSAT